MQDQTAGDAALRELLVTVAERTADPVRKKRVLDFLTDMPPLAQWPSEEQDMLKQTCAYVTSLARMSRELAHLIETPGEKHP